MSETKINASQTTITANDIGAAPVYDTMPTAAVGYLDKIVQYVGATDASYTNGYFYKCVSDGGNPATYSWSQTNVQPVPSGLPSQTGNSGKFLTTNGTDASWATINALQNTASGTNALTLLGTATTQSYSINIGGDSVATGGGATSVGSYASCTSSDACAYGNSSSASGNYAIAVGYNARATKANSICIGAFSSSCKAANSVLLGVGENNEDGTFCWGTYVNNTRTTYKLVDNDGTIPTDRYTTTPSADGTYVPMLSIASGTPTRSWADLLTALSTITGYDATKTQSLKNVQGVLTWVDD